MLLLYSLWLGNRDAATPHYTNQWIENKAIAEQFIYANKSPSAVVVGSSMSARLINFGPQDGLYNLSFAGSSAITGLKIIEKSGLVPKHILIESNTIEVPTDDEFIESLFVPLVWELKRHVPLTQKINQPINVLMTSVMNRFTKPVISLAEERATLKVGEKQLARKILQNERTVEVVKNADLSEMKAVIDRLGKNGTRFTFFEMPVHPKINRSSVYRIRDERVLSEFPEIKYLNLSSDQHNEYLTADAIHLYPASALHFGEKLKKFITQGAMVQ